MEYNSKFISQLGKVRLDSQKCNTAVTSLQTELHDDNVMPSILCLQQFARSQHRSLAKRNARKHSTYPQGLQM